MSWFYKVCPAHAQEHICKFQSISFNYLYHCMYKRKLNAWLEFTFVPANAKLSHTSFYKFRTRINKSNLPPPSFVLYIRTIRANSPPPPASNFHTPFEFHHENFGKFLFHLWDFFQFFMGNLPPFFRGFLVILLEKLSN